MALAKCGRNRVVSMTWCRLFSNNPSKDALWEKNRKGIISGKKKVLKWYVDPRKTFSDYTWSNVQEQFGLENPVIGNILPQIQDINQDCIDDLLKRWELCRRKTSSFPCKSDRECTEYIMYLILSLPDVDNVWYVSDYCVNDTVITGSLDFGCMASKGFYSPIMSILKARDSGIVQGRARSYVQLLSCYDLAQKSYCKYMADQNIRGVSEKQLLKGFPLCMYGVISTVSEWVFVRFDGKEWLESNVICIKPDFKADKERVKQVVTTLYSIIVHQSACVQMLGERRTISDCVHTLI